MEMWQCKSCTNTNSHIDKLTITLPNMASEKPQNHFAVCNWFKDRGNDLSHSTGTTSECENTSSFLPIQPFANGHEPTEPC